MELHLSFFPVIRAVLGHLLSRGEKIVIRILDPKSRTFDIEQLRFEAGTAAVLKDLLSRPTGMLLLTGPTDFGKTTTIYASLCPFVEQHGSGISTVEEPAEFNLARDFTYPLALRSLMRQNPQVIMIGEIRDPETAAIAVQAGLSGHLVISAIHFGGTAGVFARMINMGVEPFLLASSIIGVLSLRLVHKNCPLCAMPYPPDPALLKRVSKTLLSDASWRRGGCYDGTGFAGRAALTGKPAVNEPIRAAMMEKLRTRKLQSVVQEQGMKTL